MNDERPKLDERSFQNYQRILASHPTLTILSFVLTFTASGIVGIYVIFTNEFIQRKAWCWSIGLGILMSLITLSMRIVWSNEHNTFQIAKGELEKDGVKFPDTGCQKGRTYCVFRSIFFIAITFWLLFTGYSLSNILGSFCKDQNQINQNNVSHNVPADAP